VLADDLAGRPQPEDAGKVWAEVAPEYRAKFPPEASTIGPPDWHRV
jgi:hypothetical protein